MFEAVAVNVILVPEQIGEDVPVEMLTEGVTAPLTVNVMEASGFVAFRPVEPDPSPAKLALS